MDYTAAPAPRSDEGIKIVGDFHALLSNLSTVSQPEATELAGWIGMMTVLQMANPELPRAPALTALREIGTLCQITILALSEPAAT